MNIISVNKWCWYVHLVAKTKGWWRPVQSIEKILVNIHSEVSEASEQARIGKYEMYYEEAKPEGVQAELADVVIRVMDYFEHKGWNLNATIRAKMKYNETRPYRHGNKKY